MQANKLQHTSCVNISLYAIFREVIVPPDSQTGHREGRTITFRQGADQGEQTAPLNQPSHISILLMPFTFNEDKLSFLIHAADKKRMLQAMTVVFPVFQIEKSSSKNLVLRSLMNTLSSGFSARSL
jgi:hypothetical protein